MKLTLSRIPWRQTLALAMLVLTSLVTIALPLAPSGASSSLHDEVAVSAPSSSQQGLKEPSPLGSELEPTAPAASYAIIYILVEFTDKAHTFVPDDLKPIVIDELNTYYEEVSFGTAHVTGGTTIWLDLGYPRSHYVTGTTYPSDQKVTLVWDAIALADPTVNFASYQAVVIIHAGRGQEESQDWRDYWSCSWSGLNIPTDEGVIHDAIVCPELRDASQMTTVGVFAHEFGHRLGLPDLYDVSYAEHFVDHWCLMGSGSWNGPLREGESPAHMMGYCKVQLGYVSGVHLVTLSSSDLSVFVEPLENVPSSTGVQLLKIAKDSNHYYLVEVRQQVGYDTYLRGHGVLLSYVDETLESGHGIVNIVDSHPSTATKDDGAFGVGPGDVTSYSSQDGVFTMLVDGISGLSYNVTILRAYAEFTNLPEGTVIPTSDFTVQWTGGSSVPISRYELYVDGALKYSQLGASCALTGLTAGNHTATLVMVRAGGARRLTIQSHFAVDLAAPTIQQVFQMPATPGLFDVVQVIMIATDDTWVAQAQVYYRLGTGTSWEMVNMTHSTGFQWYAILGMFLPGDTVSYFAVATDAANHAQTDNNGGNYYSFTVGVLSPMLLMIVAVVIIIVVVVVIVVVIQRVRRRGRVPSATAPPSFAAPAPAPAVQFPAPSPTTAPEPAVRSGFCNLCGARLLPGAKFCSRCGAKTTE